MLSLGRLMGAPSHSYLPWEGSPLADAAPPLRPLHPPPTLAAGLMPPLCPLQEMLAIVKSIYDMMGRHTYPLVREDAPLEHVERFFQVSALAWISRGKQREEEETPAQGTQGKPLPSLSAPFHKEVKWAPPTLLVVRTRGANENALPLLGQLNLGSRQAEAHGLQGG